MKTFLAKVKEAVIADSYGKNKAGNVVVRHGYFYHSGRTAEKEAASVSAQLKKAGIPHTIVAQGDHWAPFRGDATVAQSSHMWVEIKEGA